MEKTLIQQNVVMVNIFCQSPGPLLNQGSTVFCFESTQLKSYLLPFNVTKQPYANEYMKDHIFELQRKI